ncbi:hypothetical protein T484DRAFT_1854113 [Baffinella frigidus]|nr:hypothetical protein T484DRAFT_1854113 [Cryptophyta sp. CCMP2293]
MPPLRGLGRGGAALPATDTAARISTPAPAPADLAAILQQSAIQNQEMMATQNQEMTRILAEALASTQFQAPKITAPYDIHHPPPDGKHPSLVRHNASLNFDGKEVPLHAWVNSIEAFCKLHKTCAPALLASGYLIKGAAAWLHAKYGEQDMDTDYINKSNAIYQQRKTHSFLKDYKEHFFIETFRFGLDRELQSRMPAITTNTTYDSYIVQALHIARPLEDDNSDEDDDPTDIPPSSE